MESTSAFTSVAIYDILKEEILNLTIKPGQLLSENDVCDRFQVSRTPVRTAFQRLKERGLLSIVPYKSTTATLLDFDLIDQLIYMRIAVESMVLRDFLNAVDRMTIEKVRYNIRRQEILLSGEFEADEFYEIDSKLHSIWFSYMHKESLWHSIQRSQVNYTRFRMLDIVAMQNFEEIYREHVALFEVILAKDADAIEPLIRRHLYGGINRLGDRIHKEFGNYFVKKEPKE